MTLHLRVLVAACSLLAFVADSVAGQRPGEIVGTVVDVVTAIALEGVAITLPELQRRSLTDAAGRFELRAIEPGDWTLHITRLGFASRTVSVPVRNGEATRITIRLAPEPVALASVQTDVTRASEGTHIDRAAIERSGARTAGDALRAAPGIVVRTSGPGSPQHISLRGMAPDAVLVLVDGVPLNDPLTGEADLSLVDASSVAAITVLPGARSAQFGPRAAAGVIRIETRTAAGADRHIALGVGSFGAWDAALAWSGGKMPTWNAGASLRAQDGSFDYTLPDEIGGGSRRRENGDVKSFEAHAGAGLRFLHGDLDVRAGYDALERGLPGRGFAPSPHARQQSDRLRAALLWQRATSRSTFATLVSATHQWFTNVDAQPPFGLPYADTTRATYIETRIDLQRSLIDDVIAGAGVEVRNQHLSGTALDAGAPPMQLDAGVFAHGAVPLDHFNVTAQARLDRDPVSGGGVPSHSLTLSWTGQDIGLHVAHRSSYSPPTPGDRFFRDAVGIEPNPNLEAERVPGEVEVGASVRAAVAGWAAALRGSAYRGDIDGMILWAPDYRFVWSPYNQDAKRLGAEVSVEVLSPGRVARIAATWTHVRATYDRGADDDHVQIAYRPRRSATIDAALMLGATRLAVTTRYTGLRTTAPSTLNTLPAFWTHDVAITHERDIAGWSVAFDLRVNRVFDEDESLIFGFPEPGRSVRFGVRIGPDATPSLLSSGASR